MFVPVFEIHERTLLADLETPVSAYLKLRPAGARFLLETVESGAKLGRYSFVGLHPLLELESVGAITNLICGDGRRFAVPGDPAAVLAAVLRCYACSVPGSPGNLLGGAIGYLGFEYVQQIERVPVHAPDGLPPLARFLVPRSVVTFDHHRRMLFVRTMTPGKESREIDALPPELAVVHAAWLHAVTAAGTASERVLEELATALSGPLPPDAHAAPVRRRFRPEGFPAVERYEAMVEGAREYIRAGDIFQVVLSQTLEGEIEVTPFAVYRALRMLNPSPYLFYLDFGPTVLVGSSPEVLVKLESGIATVRPIAGTRPRGADAASDRALGEELLADEKERAEHVMLVDLGRNDLGRVCSYQSVEVSDFMTLERYSHVMHMVSYVRGRLRPELDRFDLLRATFPAGTVSGAPKVRALEIIHELEGRARGPYAGAVGYLGPDGEMDLCITIRTLLFQGSRVRLQAGAGIVADSDPRAEHLECQSKMGALLASIRRAEEGLP